MRKNDLILIGGILCAALLLFIGMLWYGSIGTSDTVCIKVGGEVFGSYPLYPEAPLYIDIDGHNIIEISDGLARMIDADCPDGLCMHQGTIHRPLESIVCLPNKVIVEIQGSPQNEFDAVVK